MTVKPPRNLSQEQYSHLRDKLRARHESLAERESRLENEGLRELTPEATGEISSARLHPGDLGTQTYDQQLDLALAERQLRELREIEVALEKISNGTYGYCETCGREISLPRLEIVPEARLCAECLRARETYERNRTFGSHEPQEDISRLDGLN